MNFTLEPAALNNLQARFFDNWVYFTGYSTNRETIVFRKINLYDGQIVRMSNIPAAVEFLV